MQEGFYKVDYVGNRGSGVAVLALNNGFVVGVDVSGGTYDGIYEWNSVTNQIDVEVKVKLPPGVRSVVQGLVASIGGLTFMVSCSFPREARNAVVLATTDIGPVKVTIDLLRAFE